MKRKVNDIFISYRRDGGFATANHLFDLLTHDGYTVSFDIDTLREGDFDKLLLSRIDECTDFILIVDKHTFDKTSDDSHHHEDDWLHRELAHALAQNKNVIPVLLTGVSGIPRNLPADIAAVATKNGPEYNKSYFDEFYRKLKSFLHSEPQVTPAAKRRRATMLAVIAALVALAGMVAVLLAQLRDGGPTGRDVPGQVVDTTLVNPVMGEYVYTGPVDENGQPHGQGLAKFSQGDWYKGEFNHGEFEGNCTYINHAEGDKFVGTYKDNQRSEGTYVWKDGTYFTGTYLNNELHKGTLYDVNGKVLEVY